MALLSLSMSLVCAPAPALASEPASKALFADCRGTKTAAPTVILIAGAFGASPDFDRVLDDLARGGRTCAYDRAGTGSSSASHSGPDVVSIAHGLYRLLDQLGENAPVILVGHSNGALYAETFAALWPERVAGLVYVNGVGTDALADPALIADLRQERRLSDLAAIAGHMGAGGLVANILATPDGMGPSAAARKRQGLTNARSLKMARDEDRAMIDGLAIPREAGGPVASIPIAVIVGAPDPNDRLAKSWRRAEVAPAGRARRAWVLDAVGATHVSPLGRDRAWLIAAVNWLREMANGAEPVENSAPDH